MLNCYSQSRQMFTQHASPDLLLQYHLRVLQPAAPERCEPVTETLAHDGVPEHDQQHLEGPHGRRGVDVGLQEHQDPVETQHALHVVTETGTWRE